MTTWFHSKDLSSTIDLPTVVVDDIYGYVLPHAGTQYTGDIIQHTLQFCPKNIHEIHSGLGCVVHPKLNEIPVMDQPQHGRDFGLIGEPSHAPNL